MILEPVFERFVKESPLSVMARATVENALKAADVDKLFEETSERGYTKELLFSTTVELMSLVCCGTVPTVQSAFQQMVDRVPVRLKCVYEKLQHIETAVSSALVRHVFSRCRDLTLELGGCRTPLLPGYRVQILDGNKLAATQKRLHVTRGHSAGVLPGHSLVVLDPELMLIGDVICCEDAYTQERALLHQVLPLVQQRDVWIEDRNFCTVDFLLGIDQRQAFFVVRRHGNMTIESDEDFGPEIETDTGWASERKAWVCRDNKRLLQVRQVRVRLKSPTQDGDTELDILTNLSDEAAGCDKVAWLYGKRWTIEGAFLELTMALNCELNTLGYPKAALFGFCVAVVAYNVLAVLKAALVSVHGEEQVKKEVSTYYMALELATVYAGMMIALPASHWGVFADAPVSQLACFLKQCAARVNLKKIKKAPPRKPTKNPTVPIKDNRPHLSTKRLLDSGDS